MKYIKKLEEITLKDIPSVGGKTASLGEMFCHLKPKGINIPNGFAITAEAYTLLLKKNKLDQKIKALLDDLDSSEIKKLAEKGRTIRSLIREVPLPDSLREEITQAYRELSQSYNMENADVAVRSSATAEDLPDASFAGQQETFLNVRGSEALLESCRNCFASLYTDRAISYRTNKGFKHEEVKLSICVQKMVRSDLGASGVTFTLDPESGARNVILITSAYGLGENVVGGRVDPDEFLVQKDLLGKGLIPILRRRVGAKQVRMVYSGHGTRTTKNIEVSARDRGRLSLSDEKVLTLANWARIIEGHYSKLAGEERPMDIEWGLDGETQELFILQARPETVHGSKSYLAENFVLEERSRVLLSGRAVGTRIGSGKVRIIEGVEHLSEFQEGEILVTDMTDPDWEPVMKKASAIITNRGGRTCHAAIVSREHGVPCLVGTGEATEVLKDGELVTVSCAEGDEGRVYEGELKFSISQESDDGKKKILTKLFINLANPSEALNVSRLPVDGVGLARMEFIINTLIKVHPMALVKYDKLPSGEEKEKIKALIGDSKPKDFFVDRLAEGLALLAGAFYPRPVIVRFSDFKTNEYAHLLGGSQFEPKEENPMLGFRGASRYYHPKYREAFALECAAIKKVREEIGLTNVKVMIPFCRSVKEGEAVLAELQSHGLTRGDKHLEIYVMSELPTNILCAHDFAQIFDGFSIGSNDLTQMVLGIDRDSEILGESFDEKDPAVKRMLVMAIEAAKEAGRPIGICGQAPTDFPEITELLVTHGIDSISVSPDAVIKTRKVIAQKEAELHSRDPSLFRRHGYSQELSERYSKGPPS